MTSYHIARIGLFTMCSLLITSEAAMAADTQVQGRVIVSGAPLGGGQVVLHLANGEFLGTRVKQDGTYSFQKLSVPPGEYTVTIEGKGVPAKYSDEKVSGLRVDVRDGSNTFDFDLS